MVSVIKALFLLLSLILTNCSSPPTTEKQKLSANIYSEPPTLDSRLATDTISMNVLCALYEGLLRINEQNLPEKALAKEIILSEDQCCYTFILKESFWNNGEPLTAHDFLSTWRTILSPDFPAPFAYKFFDIKNAKEVKEGIVEGEKLAINAIDSHTLQIELKQPCPYFLELLAFPTFFPIYNKEMTEKEKIVSNGPFSMELWDHHNQIILKKNDYYWDKNAVSLEEIHFLMVSDTTTEYYMYEQGEVDIAGSPLSILSPDLIANVKDLKIMPLQALYYYSYNTKIPVLTSTAIRQALAKAIERQEIVDHILQGGQEIATSLVPPLSSRMNKNYFKDGSILEARKLLQEGMREVGIEQFPPLTLSYNQSDDHHKIAQMIQQQWKKNLGIEVNLEHSDWQVYLDKLSHKNFEIARTTWVSEISDPIAFLNLFRNQDHVNISDWIHPHYQQLLNEAEKMQDEQKRAALLDQAEALLMEEMPLIPLFFINGCYLQKKYVKDIQRTRSGMIDFKRAYVRGPR